MTRAQLELAVLRKYAAGLDMPVIARELGIAQEVVADVASAVNFQRGRATELLRQREAALFNHRRNHQEAAVPEASEPETLEQLLERAEQTGKLKTKAIRIRTMLDDLRRDLEHAERVAEAERKVEQLRADLAAATEELRTLARPATAQPSTPDTAPAPQDGPPPREVRTWAARNGIDCPPAGRVPKHIVERYLAAHQAGQVAA